MTQKNRRLTIVEIIKYFIVFIYYKIDAWYIESIFSLIIPLIISGVIMWIIFIEIMLHPTIFSVIVCVVVYGFLLYIVVLFVKHVVLSEKYGEGTEEVKNLLGVSAFIVLWLLFTFIFVCVFSHPEPTGYPSGMGIIQLN